jgi:hypothetical protein
MVDWFSAAPSRASVGLIGSPGSVSDNAYPLDTDRHWDGYLITTLSCLAGGLARRVGVDGIGPFFHAAGKPAG